jgi:hypothetical protein
VLIETALGMANVEAIAQSSKRLEAMSFGVADYAASTRARTTVIGGVNKDSVVLADRGCGREARETFWTDPWHAAQTRMMVACRAYGLRPIDGPFGDFGDPEGFRSAAKRAAVLGYEGKWAIHPVADRARQRGVHAVGGRGHQGAPDHRGDGAGGARRQGCRVARRPPDRHREHPHGRGAAREGGRHRDGPGRSPAVARTTTAAMTDSTRHDREVRAIVPLLAIAGCASGIAQRVMDPLLPSLSTEFDAPLAAVAWVITCFSLGYAVSQLAFGPLGDRHGKLRVITTVCGASAVASLACAFAPGLPTLLAARVFAGAMAAGLIPLSMAWIGDAVPYERRQPVIARFAIGQILGVSLG